MAACPTTTAQREDAKKCQGWTAGDCLLTSNCAILEAGKAAGVAYNIIIYIYIIHNIYIYILYIYRYYIYIYILHIYVYISCITLSRSLALFLSLSLSLRVFFCFGTRSGQDGCRYFFVVLPFSWQIASHRQSSTASEVNVTDGRSFNRI